MSKTQAKPQQPHFIDNPVIDGRHDHYAELNVSTARIVESWRISLFSYEWLRRDGQIKDLNELSPAEQAKRKSVEDCLRDGLPLEKPVLGIGMLDNVEIGAGRAVFLTLAAHGIDAIPVHVPKSHADEFVAFLSSG